MRSIFMNSQGMRAGWRVLIYAALLFGFGYAVTKIEGAFTHGQQMDQSSPAVVIVMMGGFLIVVLLASWVMAKIEHRSLAEYGLPWRRAFRAKFWQGAAVGLVSLCALLGALRLAGAYSAGSLQLHGAAIVKYAVLWLIAGLMGALLEEFFYRGYLLYTLNSGMGFWTGAVITSAFMAAMHLFNPGWTALGIATVFGFGLIACFLLRRTGNLWMPIGLHFAWNWGEIYLFGVPCSGLAGQGHLLQGSLHGSPLLTGMPFGIDAGWPNVVLFLVWWLAFAKWFPRAQYPRVATAAGA